MKNNGLFRLFLLLNCLLIGITVTNAQIITTVAGSDSSGYTGNNGPAISARLNKPYSVVMDASGNLYFTEKGNHSIRKVNTAGVITTIAGDSTYVAQSGYYGDGRPATASILNNPQSMGIDGYGNIYFVDYGNNVIRKIDTSSSHIITTIAGTGAYGFSGDNGPAVSAALNHPTGIAVDMPGNIYIADRDNHRIRKINTSGIIATIAGTGVAGSTGDGGQAISAKVDPITIAIDPFGNIYYSDSISTVYRVIRKITPAGTISTFLNSWVQAITFDNIGNMFFTDLGCYVRRVHSGPTVVAIAGNGSCTYSGDGDTATYAGLATPMGMVSDNNGNLYVAEYNGAHIRKISYSPLAVNEVSENAITVNVYPNPASETFTIEMPSANNNVSIVISDMLGKIVETRTVLANNGIREKFDVSKFPQGIYLAKITSGNDTYREKVVVR